MMLASGSDMKNAIPMVSMLVLAGALSCADPAANPVEKPTSDSTPVQISSSQADEDSIDYLDAARMIVAGEMIGQIHLEMNTDSVIALLGKPDRSDAAMGKSWMVWTAGHAARAQHETAVYTARNMGVGKEESRVKEIRITSPFFHTADSLHAGLSLEKIRLKRPGLQPVQTAEAATSSGPVFYDDVSSGISFEFDAAGSCVAIIVHAKGKKLTDIYLPLTS